MSKQPKCKDLKHRVKELEQESVKRQQTEKALRESEEKLRTIINTSHFPIAVADTNDDNIIFWSQSAIEMFGHNPKIVSEWYELAYPDPDYRQEVINCWKPLLEKAQKTKTTINTGEYQIHCQDGSIRTCELYVTFLQDLLIVTFNDLTEQRKADERIAALALFPEENTDPVLRVDRDMSLLHRRARAF